MKFKITVKSEFKAYINSIKFTHEQIYNTVYYILHILQYKFRDINIKDKFIDDLKWAVTNCYNDSPDNPNLEEIKYELGDIINKTNDFNKLKFKVNNSDYYFKNINSKINSYIIK